MSNPFAAASTATPVAPAAPTVAAPTAPIAAPAADPTTTVEELAAAASNEEAGSDGKKARKKSDKPRKERNRTITDADKKHVLAHYCSAATGDIAKQLGLTRAQVYNVVRNTRKELEKHLENAELPAEARQRIELALSKLPRKDFNGGASGGTRKSQSVDDILAAFGI